MSMNIRFATWNCQWGGLGEKVNKRKLDFLINLRPSLAVVSEYGRGGCCIERSIYADQVSGRGISIIEFSGCLRSYERSRIRHANLPCVLPAVWRPESGGQEWRILGLWATGHASGYLMTSWLALDAYGEWLRDGPSVVMGDFNQSAVWSLNRPINFRNIIERFDDIGMHSAYHAANNVLHGEEEIKTFIGSKGWSTHIDFIFISKSARIERSLIVNGPSDHAAVIADVSI